MKGALFGLLFMLLAAIGVAQEQDAAVLKSRDTNPYAQRIQQLEQQVFERDNEIVHLNAEWANCRATVDSSQLTTQAIELVRRCESTFGVKCAWDDKLKRVVRETPPKEPER